MLAAVRAVFTTPKRKASHHDGPSSKRARIHTMADSADAVDGTQAGQSSLVAGPGPSATHELDTSSPRRPFAAARLSDLTPRRTLPSQPARVSATVNDPMVGPSGAAQGPLQHLYAPVDVDRYGQPLPFTPPHSIFRSPVRHEEYNNCETCCCWSRMCTWTDTVVLISTWSLALVVHPY